jgi:hypothetical protein
MARLRDTANILVICTVVLLCWWPRLPAPIDLRYDGGAYYILGSSLAQGSGFRLLNEPGDIKSTLHPPLLPVIVAAHQWILGTSDPFIVGPWLQVSFCLLSVVFAISAYLMFRMSLSLALALIATLVCVLHINTQFLSGLLFAELLFAVTTTLFYVTHDRGSRRQEWVAASLAIASYLLRTVGIALFAAWIGESVLKRNVRATLVRVAIALVPIIGWHVYIFSVESEAQYRSPAYEYQRADYMYPNLSYIRNASLVDPFVPEKGHITTVARMRRFAGNVTRMPAKVGEAVSTVRGYWEGHLAAVSRLLIPLPNGAISWSVLLFLSALGLLTLAGTVLLAIRGEWFVALYMAAYLASLCMTPWPNQFGRYLMPLAPFLVLSLCSALLWIQTTIDKRAPDRWHVMVQMGTASGLSAILLVQAITIHTAFRDSLLPVAHLDRAGRSIEYRQLYYVQPDRSFDEALDWFLVHGKPGRIAASAWPHWIYLRTGMKAVLPPMEPDAKKAQRLLDSVPVTYLFLERTDVVLEMKRYVEPVLHREGAGWKLVFRTRAGDVEIYERQS